MIETIIAMNIFPLDKWAAKDFSRKPNSHYNVSIVKMPPLARASL